MHLSESHQSGIHTLSEVIEQATSWYLLEDGTFSIVDPEENVSDPSLVTTWHKDEFALLDSRLPEVLRFIVEDSGDSVQRFGELLRTTIRHWKTPGIVLFKAPCKALELDEVYHVKEILGVQLQVSTGKFELDIAFYTTIKLDDVDIVSYCSKSPRLFDVNELEILYPGFKKRYDIGVSLELDSEELVKYTISVDSTNSKLDIPSNLSLG